MSTFEPWNWVCLYPDGSHAVHRVSNDYWNSDSAWKQIVDLPNLRVYVSIDDHVIIIWRE